MKKYDPTVGRIVDEETPFGQANKSNQSNKIQRQTDRLMPTDSFGSPQPIEPERITRETIIEAQQTRLVLDKKTFDTLVGVIPEVSQREYWLSHSSATTVTNFLGGQEGHHLYILGNGNTELTHGTNIFTSTGANKTLAADKMYHFICHDDKWYEVCE